jgi:hypothetical protein
VLNCWVTETKDAPLGPAALTDGLAELQKIIERWANPEP